MFFAWERAEVGGGGRGSARLELTEPLQTEQVKCLT